MPVEKSSMQVALEYANEQDRLNKINMEKRAIALKLEEQPVSGSMTYSEMEDLLDDLEGARNTYRLLKILNRIGRSAFIWLPAIIVFSFFAGPLAGWVPAMIIVGTILTIAHIPLCRVRQETNSYGSSRPLVWDSASGSMKRVRNPKDKQTVLKQYKWKIHEYERSVAEGILK